MGERKVTNWWNCSLSREQARCRKRKARTSKRLTNTAILHDILRWFMDQAQLECMRFCPLLRVSNLCFAHMW